MILIWLWAYQLAPLNNKVPRLYNPVAKEDWGTVNSSMWRVVFEE
jgi:hypothetical protein